LKQKDKHALATQDSFEGVSENETPSSLSRRSNWFIPLSRSSTNPGVSSTLSFLV